jgi:hypothetical protein
MSGEAFCRNRRAPSRSAKASPLSRSEGSLPAERLGLSSAGSAGRTASRRTSLSLASSFFRNLAARRSKPAPPVPSMIDSAKALSRRMRGRSP